LWQLGFRPFYLLASVFAALSIALWAVQYAGWLAAGYLPGPVWHELTARGLIKVAGRTVHVVDLEQLWWTSNS